MLALAAGGKFFFTQSWPTASPRAPSVIAVHCFQRGVGSFCPARVLPKNAKFSSKKALGRLLAAPWIVCHRRYDFHPSTGSKAIRSFSALKKLGVATFEGIELADLDVFEVDRELEVRNHLLKVRDGVDVVDVLGHAHLGAARSRPWRARFRSSSQLRLPFEPDRARLQPA